MPSVEAPRPMRFQSIASRSSERCGEEAANRYYPGRKTSWRNCLMTAPERLRAHLKEPGLVVMPAVWDGLTAKLTAAAGFKTAFLSGSCVAASRLGGPDLDLISFGEMYDSFNMVRGAAPDLLVLADGDHGYGNAMNVQRTVRAYGRAGAAAVLIEDKITPRALTAAGKPCLPREEAQMKIRAAVEAAKESGICRSEEH